MKLFIWSVALFVAATAAQAQPNLPPVSEREKTRPDEEFHDPFASETESPRSETRVSDPLERMNRAFYKFNDKLYFWVVKPSAKAYGKVAPAEFRVSIRNAFHNLSFPVRGANNLLQGKFKRTGIETARFLINSSVGIGGLFDPAHDEWQLDAHSEDLDQTLGFYGLPSGAYLNWPVFGPSTIRGTVGRIGDSFLQIAPWRYFESGWVTVGVRSFEVVNSTSMRIGEYESFKKASIDPYIALRNAYIDNRRSRVND
jgi:phospholipid-binding lipoprotein MlaA